MIKQKSVRPAIKGLLMALIIQGGTVSSALPQDSGEGTKVTIGIFIRAETGFYFNKQAFGKLKHNRTMADINKQTWCA